MKILFDKKTCSRCGGSGHYSYNPTDGTVCFGCGGSGKKLSRDGVKARAVYDAAMKISAENVQVGMMMMVSLMGGPAKRMRVSEVVQGLKNWTTNGDTVDGIGLRYGDKLTAYSGRQEKLTRALCPDIHDSIEAILEGVKGVTVEV